MSLKGNRMNKEKEQIWGGGYMNSYGVFEDGRNMRNPGRTGGST